MQRNDLKASKLDVTKWVANGQDGNVVVGLAVPLATR